MAGLLDLFLHLYKVYAERSRRQPATAVLLDVVLPEVGAMRMAIDEHHQHKDVYWHSLTVLRQAIGLEDDGPDLVLRWAALLHDIGKPATRKHEPTAG